MFGTPSLPPSLRSNRRAPGSSSIQVRRSFHYVWTIQNFPSNKNRTCSWPRQFANGNSLFPPHPIKRLLLTHYNDCLLTGTAPDHWKLSKVVMICKGNQKNSRSPSSSRPISLASSKYKVYACMLQQRLAHSIDQFLHPNQYGFRAGHSISTPLFLLLNWNLWT